tara:strand:- start:313 stop:774 length:462 start_codon:yes stop_codon:yes gene_type:complete
MGSTVAKTIFHSTTTETIDINGVKQQAIRKLSETPVTDYSHRILTAAANQTSTLLSFGANNAGGQVSADEISYVRISNLDDSSSVRLVINMVDASNGSFHIELPALKSHMVCTKSSAIVPQGQDFAAYGTIANIQVVTPASSSVDIELFLVSK